MSSLKTGVLAEPKLVGREKELEELQRCLDSAVQGKGTTVFISGEAGSGKTRVTREFLNNARRRGIAVMAGWCLSDAQVPYFPFMEAFNSYYASSETEPPISLTEPETPPKPIEPLQIITREHGITAWLTGPEQALTHGKTEVVSPQVWKDQLFAGAAKTLHTIAVQAPIILFIEDVHWADSASLSLLHYVARAIHDSEKVLLLATFRSEELTTDAEGHPHPLAETLRLMRREELFTEINLPLLNQDKVSKIAEYMIGGTLQPKLAEKLTTESKGNPLFVVESLRMLNERRSLVHENNEWRLAVDELGIPDRIKDIILRRLACLKYAQRRVLDAASIIGEEFDVELLNTVLGQDYLEILETLNVVAHSTSLVRVDGNNYRFDHAKSRETLYEELALPLKRGYHNKIAEKLESTKNEIPRLSDIAYHYAQAENVEKAVKFAMAAGQDDLAKWSNAEAIKHFNYVLENTRDNQAPEKRIALEGLGDAYAASSLFSKAIKTFDALASSSEGVLKLHAIRKATDAAWNKGDMPDLLVEYAKRAKEIGISDRLEMARIIDNRGKAWGWAGRGEPKQDLADYESALEVFEEENSLADVAEALQRSGTVKCLFYDDLREKGLGQLLLSAAMFRELGDVRKEAESKFWTAQGLAACGLSAEARREYTSILGINEKLGIFGTLASTYWKLSRASFLEWKLEEAISMGLKELEYANKSDSDVDQTDACANLLRLYSALGDLEKADEYFERMNKAMPHDLGSTNLHEIPTALGMYFAAKGQWKESNEAFRKALENNPVNRANEIPARTGYAWALESQGRFEESKDQLDLLKKLREQKTRRVEDRFGRANLQLFFMTPTKVHVTEEFEMRLDIINLSRKVGLLVKLDGLIPQDFSLACVVPPWCRLTDGSLSIDERRLDPFQVETVKFKLKAQKAGSYSLSPELTYKDECGNLHAFKISPLTLVVQPAKLAYEPLLGRVATGKVELDRLLLGGIPEGYAVVLVSSSSDERSLLIKRFLEAGAEAGETTFYLTTEVGTAKLLVDTHKSEFSVFICSPQADSMVENVPNVNKLKGVENLTEIDIALTKYFRMLTLSKSGPKRACIQIVSDVLLQHHAVTTRKWLSALLPNLKAKGFTTLAIIDPQMHPAEESRAIISLFDGEIAITEKETAKGSEKILRVRRLVDQKYLEGELVLNSEKLSS